jgi:hypothetical protein
LRRIRTRWLCSQAIKNDLAKSLSGVRPENSTARFSRELLSINREDRSFQGAQEQLLLDGGARCVGNLSRYSASGNEKNAKAPRLRLRNRDPTSPSSNRHEEFLQV